MIEILPVLSELEDRMVVIIRSVTASCFCCMG